MSDLNVLIGKTVVKIEGLVKYSDEVNIHVLNEKAETEIYRFYHSQSCCENVSLEDFDTDRDSLKGGLIVNAYESSNPPNPPECTAESFTWTFYKIETNLGGLWMRWLGTSNGYYSESVSFTQLTNTGELPDDF